MKKIFCCLMFLAGSFSLQGCFWHSSTTDHEVDHEVSADQGNTTVMTSAPATITTSH